MSELQKLRNREWKKFVKRKGERWLFEATHAAGLDKTRQTFYDGWEAGFGEGIK
jgi:hypothetical protein